tara:strand:- start:824 stop:2233 length:1410 start_codon:yes stop_codon:yes gene_type:complete
MTDSQSSEALQEKPNIYVLFDIPDISGNTIRFSWTSSHLSDLFRKGKDFVEFEYHQKVELNPMIAYNQLYAIFFPILHSAIHGNIDVGFAEALPRDQIQLWKNIRDSDSVNIVSEMIDNNFGLKEVSNESRDGGIALLYGGGKDSLGALSLYSRMYPTEEINLLRIHWSRQSISRHRKIFNESVIDPLKEKIKLNYLECSSTLHINLKDRKTAHHVGINFHHACCLPYYADNRFRIVNYSYDALEFFTSPTKGYPSIRPEKANQMTNILRKLEIPTSIRNISFGIPSFSHFDIILSDERNLIPLTYMCEDTNERWCYNCRKCFTFGLMCLEAQLSSANSGIDYVRLFSSTEYFGGKVLPILELQNDKYSSILAYEHQFSSFRHLLSNVKPNELVKNNILSQNDASKLISLVELYALEIPVTRTVWSRAIQFEDPEYFSKTLEQIQQIGISIFDGSHLTLNNKNLSEYQF